LVYLQGAAAAAAVSISSSQTQQLVASNMQHQQSGTALAKQNAEGTAAK
jgi:hypothetical protein